MIPVGVGNRDNIETATAVLPECPLNDIRGMAATADRPRVVEEGFATGTLDKYGAPVADIEHGQP